MASTQAARHAIEWCTACGGLPADGGLVGCVDCNWTGNRLIQQTMARRARTALNTVLLEHEIIRPRDLDDAGRWAH